MAHHSRAAGSAGRDGPGCAAPRPACSPSGSAGGPFRLPGSQRHGCGCRACRTRSGRRGAPSGSPRGSAVGSSWSEAGLRVTRLGTQKVTVNAKNRPDLAERASRLAGAEASGCPVMWSLPRSRPLSWENRFGGAKGIRTPDLLRAMQHGFVRWRRARSGYRSSELLWRLGTSRWVWRNLEALVLGLVLVCRTSRSREVQPWQSGSWTTR